MTPRAGGADPNDPGLLTPAQTALLTDRYQLQMAASYQRRGLDDPAVFELFVRELPPGRAFLLVAGVGPALRMLEALRFGRDELEYLRSIGFDEEFLNHLARMRFTGDVDAMPEGTVAFAGEPLVRVTAPRIQAQLVETLLLNQLNFQVALASKAARIVLAAGGGRAGAGGRVVDFSPRRDHGVDAAMKAARCAAIAGAGGTSNVAAARRYGLAAVGTMAHAYVMSFAEEEEAFRAFLQDAPEQAILLVDTYDTPEGVRRAIAAQRATGVPLRGVRIDSGDLLALSRDARRRLDEAGLRDTAIVASGDLDERRIAALVAAGAPIDLWGVGTELGTSRDAPTVGGVYKLVADRPGGGGWRPVFKRSPDKVTIPGAKQVFRRTRGGELAGDVLGEVGERVEGEPLLVPAMRGGKVVLAECLDTMRERARDQLSALPAALRELVEPGVPPPPYPVELSPRMRELAALASGS